MGGILHSNHNSSDYCIRLFKFVAGHCQMSNKNNRKDNSGGATKMALDKAFALHAWEPEFKSPESP